jgi:flavin-dependent thymidylate synthase
MTTPRVELFIQPSITHLPEGMGTPRTDQLQGSDAAKLIEIAARECYDSFGRGRSSEDFHSHLIESGHHNPAYHAYFSFRVSGFSNAFIRELLRHHVGATPSQRSTRYVDESESDVVMHPLIADFFARGDRGERGYVAEVTAQAVEAARHAYNVIVPRLEAHLVERGVSKTQARKQARGAARMYLPMGLETSLIWTANLYAIRNVIGARGVEGADGEARVFAKLLFEQVYTQAPVWFDHFRFVFASDFGLALDEGGV